MPITEAPQASTFEKIFGMTFEKWFEKDVARKMPEEALRSFIASVQGGHLPKLITDEFKPEFPTYATVFLALLDDKFVRISPLKFDDLNRYPFPNFEFVRRKPGHIRVQLHPWIAIESDYNFDFEPFISIRDRAELYLAQTIAGTVHFCRGLVRLVSEKRQSIGELVGTLDRLAVMKPEISKAPNSQ